MSVTGLWRTAGWAWVLLLSGFLVLPVLIIIPASFAAVERLEFPPSALSLRWYGALVSDSRWLDSLLLSLRIAVTAAAIAVPVGLMAALARARFGALSSARRMFLLLPLVVPHPVIATGLFTMLLHARLLGSPLVLGVVHAAFALPLVLLLLVVALEAVDPLIWSAAATLGASPGRVLARVVLPIVWPSLLAAVLLVLVFSWDEVVATVFIGPIGPPPLPALMFTYLKEVVTPVVAAVATLLLALSALLGALLIALYRQRDRRSGAVRARGA